VGARKAEAFDPALKSGRQLKIRGVVYVGRDHAFARQLVERCRTRGISTKVPTSREDVDELVAQIPFRVFVVDLADQDLIPPQLAEEVYQATGQPLGTTGRIVFSRLSRSASVVGFALAETEQACQRVLKSLRENRVQVDLHDLLLGESAGIDTVRRQIRDVASFGDVNVLVLGETGTGKELVADAIHRVGPAPDKPFLPVNCAAIPETLFEAELFGHQAGTFTGAKSERVGLIEEAGRGTVFLDEIGEMPDSLQPKLLRALDRRSFRRVGANREQPFSARIVSATNREIDDLAGLRRDLFWRLAGFTIRLPPLRSRLEDVEILSRAFLTDFARTHVMPIPELSGEALATLHAHHWPGNVRELKVVIQRAVIVARGGLITAEMLEQGLHAPPTRLQRPTVHAMAIPAPAVARLPTPAHGLGRGLRELERELILRTLERNDGNVASTARQLGIPRSTLRARLRRYDHD